MNSGTYALQDAIVRSPVLTSYMRRSEVWICGALCSMVHIVFWVIALLWFTIWGLWRIGCGLVWLLKLIWRVANRLLKDIVYVVTVLGWIIWVILVWIGGVLYRIVVVLICCLRAIGLWLWHTGRATGWWTLREFGEPAVCAFFVYLGVLSTSLLPSALLLQFAPSVLIGLALPPLAAFVIAVRVFDNRAYRRWQSANRVRLGARLLRAYSDGVMWSVWLRRR